jgi:NTE family protein
MNFESLFEVERKDFFGGSSGESSRREAVTLAFLSKDLPAEFISEQLAESLRVETGAAVVLVRLQGCSERPISTSIFDDNATVVDWAPSHLVLQGQFRPCSLFQTEAGFHVLTVSVRSGPTSPDWIASLLDPLRRHFRYVLVEAVHEETRPLLSEFIKRSDLAYLFLQPKSGDITSLAQLMRETSASSPAKNRHVKPVLCLSNGMAGSAFENLVHDSPVPIERFLHACPEVYVAKKPASSFRADVRRLAREIGGRMVGLALSSGAAKGFTHIGVIQVLEENGIEVDIVAGASIGAYIGALWNSGFPGPELERLARELESRWNFWRLLDPVFPPRQGFLRGHSLRKRLMHSIGSAHFADLARPLRVVAGNLATLDRTVFGSGEVAPAVHASMAVPGICIPVMINGEAYIDGGIVDPVPVDILRELGAARIIAVNAIPTREKMREAFEAERELARRKESRRKLFAKVLPLDKQLNKQLNYFAQGNLFEIVVRTIHGAQIRFADSSCALADIVLRPDICDDRWLDCRNPGRFIALGKQAAEQNIDKIKALVAGHELNDEPKIAPRALAAVA